MPKVTATSYASDGVKETYIHNFLTDLEAKSYIMALREMASLHEAPLKIRIDGKEI